MQNRPIHENLDTSFVNLSALVRYLRRRRFAGNVRVELSGYNADIALTTDGEMRVREHDRIAGRISEGEEALERLLIRAREPGGVINVYRAVEESMTAAAIEDQTRPVEEIPFFAEPKRAIVSVAAPHKNGNSNRNENSNRNGNPKILELEPPVNIEPPAETDSPASENDFPKPNPTSPPLEFSDKHEADVQELNPTTPQDWQMVLNLTAELLNTIDKSLAEANLEFTTAFEKALAEISGDYPFLNPADDVFDYKNGKITVRRQINAKLFTASINETLRRILEKLGRNPKFANVYLVTTHRLLALIEKRKPLYDKFSITPQLAKIIGI